MTQILNVHAFLEHSFPKSENLIPDSLERDLIQQYIRIPYHNIPIYRDAMTGRVVNPDVNFKRSCATATYCGINTGNTKVEPTIMKSVHEINKQALCSTKTGFTLQNCVLKSANYSMGLPSIPNLIDELLKMASEDVVHNLCFPKSYLLRSTAQINEAGTFLLPKRETVTFLKRRVRTRKPCESYAIIEDTTTPLPTLTKLIQNPALNWNFELDTFQKRAILCLENNQTIFVAGHTSSGKTVIAEYACAVCLRRGSRVIYTSPVKALSNQKFYDFRERFGGDVGLITGDIKLAPDAQLLIMTTEILHNMLYSESEVIKDLEIVILDEVHYINDPDRGYIWEQIMIMLPSHVLLVMLSATVPNNFELADWLGRVRGCEIHVIVTEKRPIPLEHYLYTGTGEQYTGHLHLIVDKNNCFVDSGYRMAAEVSTFPKLSPRPFTNVRGKEAFFMIIKNTWLGFVRLLKERDLLPVIAFSFSRSSLETLAKNLSSVDLTSTNEKQQINKFFSLTTSCLRKCDRKLASVKFIRDLTKRGLAVHHAGMLPVLKETVEFLFRIGLVKILFATETFSTGVNMPARCVVFTSIDKYDGHMIRPLSSSEYTQMAGRAGRRGLDAKGYVIILVSSVGKSLKSSVTGLPTEGVLRSVILGTQTRLVSQFKVTYSMILNLHRSSSLTLRDVMKRSFMEAASHRWETEQRQHLSFLNKKLDETTTLISSNDSNQTSVNSVSAFTENNDDLSESLFVYLDVRVKCPYNGIECCDSISAYYQLCYRYRQLTQSLIRTLSTKYERYLRNIFCPGRVILLHVTIKQSVWLVPGVIVNYYWETKKNGKDQLLFRAILWKLPTDSPTFFTKKQEGESETSAVVGSNNKISTAPVGEDNHSWYNCEYDEIEEKILRNIKGSCNTQWEETPVPPHLVPVFMPSVSVASVAYIMHLGKIQNN
ncbi:Helicase SKI2W [Schistosoma japonicum]|uniref:Helicase SKI2W n=1 Tax=Schistosoma japonicum TaxID=6182 RepID=A0A4Z2CUW0_SCHJA|nr:Helicase SKI2W [Schistosoma japonicum]